MEESEALKPTDQVEMKDASSNTNEDAVENTVKVSDFVETEVIVVEATLLVKYSKDEVCPDENYASKEMQSKTDSTLANIYDLKLFT